VLPGNRLDQFSDAPGIPFPRILRRNLTSSTQSLIKARQGTFQNCHDAIRSHGCVPGGEIPTQLAEEFD